MLQPQRGVLFCFVFLPFFLEHTFVNHSLLTLSITQVLALVFTIIGALHPGLPSFLYVLKNAVLMDSV